MQNNLEVTTIQFRLVEQPPHLNEYFARLAARYRSAAVHTKAEWPMHTAQGRAAYWKSQSRERFLDAHSRDDLRHVIARAVAKLETMPKGERIDFNELVYGAQVQ